MRLLPDMLNSAVISLTPPPPKAWRGVALISPMVSISPIRYLKKSVKNRTSKTCRRDKSPVLLLPVQEEPAIPHILHGCRRSFFWGRLSWLFTMKEQRPALH